jgi:AcrR family transcriptional regulator
LISHHFRDRNQLMAAVAEDVIGQLPAAVEVRVRAAGAPADAVPAVIDANVGDMNEHRAERVIAAGRQFGNFRDVDAAVAATIVQRAVESIPTHLYKHPAADLIAHASDPVRFFDAALLRSPPDPSAA